MSNKNLTFCGFLIAFTKCAYITISLVLIRS